MEAGPVETRRVMLCPSCGRTQPTGLAEIDFYQSANQWRGVARMQNQVVNGIVRRYKRGGTYQ